MNATLRLTLLVLVLVGIGMVALTTEATTIKTGSHYGSIPVQGSDIQTFTDCLNASVACEAAQNTAVVFSFNGNNYNEVQFTTGFGQLFDVFDFGSIKADTLINLPFASWGVLTCGDGDASDPQNTTGHAFDSGHQSVTGLPCTQIDAITGIPLFGGTTLYATTDFLGNGVAFTVLADGSIRFNSDFSDVVFFTSDTGQGTTATPEPGSLALLGTGIVALWAKFGRRKQA
jgi:hypothetical protein